MFKLNNRQIEQLADFTSNLGLVFFGTVIAPVFVEVDTVNLYMVTLGITFTFGSLIMSMFLLKGGIK